MEQEFEELCLKINECKNTKELFKLLDDWKIDPVSLNSWLEIILNNLYKINPQVLPYLIECLYANDNKIKFLVASMLIENTYQTIPFITNLEQIRISKEKYELLIPTIVKVFCNSYNGVADCMLLILLNNDPKGTLLDEKSKSEIIQSLEEKLEMMVNFYTENKEIPDEVNMALEIMLDVSTYLISDKVKEKIRELQALENLNKTSKIFIVKTCLINTIDLKDNLIIDLAKDELYISRLYRVLKSINKIDVFPREYLKREKFALANMIDWLKYPTELGELPTEISLIGNIEYEKNIFYIFKFKTDKETLKENGEMIGISGGYGLEEGEVEDTGFTFSKFEPIMTDYEKQAKDIIETIKGYWKARANELKK